MGTRILWLGLLALASVVVSAQQTTPPDWYNISDPPLAMLGPDSSLREFTATYAGNATAGQIVVFGRKTIDGIDQAQTWRWDGGQWTQVVTATSPPVMSEPVLAYDETAGHVVLCGPDASSSWERPTWLFDGATWTSTGVTCNWEPGSAGGYVMAVGTGGMYDLLEPWVWATPAIPLFNRPPAVSAGADQEVACLTAASTPVTFHGTATDVTPGGELAYQWTIQPNSGPALTASGLEPTVYLPLGFSQAVFTATDGYGVSASDTTSARVVVQVTGLDPPLGPLVREGLTAPVPDQAVQAGRTLPLNTTASCAGTPLTSADIAPPRIVGWEFVGAAPQISVVTSTSALAGDTSLIFRPSGGGWIYNFDTKPLGTGTWLLKIQMPDGLRYVAQLVLR